MVLRKAWLADTDDRPCLVLNAKDDQPASAVVGQATHTLGDVGGAGRAALKLDGRRLASGDQLAQRRFIHNRQPRRHRRRVAAYGRNIIEQMRSTVKRIVHVYVTKECDIYSASTPYLPREHLSYFLFKH